MMSTIKVYVCFTVKIYKYNPPKKFKQGGARPARRSWIRLCIEPIQLIYIAYLTSLYLGQLSHSVLDLCRRAICDESLAYSVHL